MPDVVVLYASISGRTRKVVEELVKEFCPLSAVGYDLRDGFVDIEKSKLVVFGSPTYGVGECHHLWEKHFARFTELEFDWSSQPVAVFALGDVKHHPKSFARAIVQLRDSVRQLNAELIGEVPVDETYNQVSCKPLLTDGKFPGLVLDQVKQCRLGSQRIQKWVIQLKHELGIIAASDTNR